MKKAFRAGLLIIGLLITACGGDDSSEAAQRACEDFVDAFVVRAGECGIAEQEARSQLLALLRGAGGSCDDVQKVADESEFYDSCLPAVKVHPCDGGGLPAACLDQLSF